MNNSSHFQIDPAASIESELEEISARLRSKSVDLSQVELILARTRAHNCLRLAIKAWEEVENGCDHSTSNQRLCHLQHCELEAALAAIEYVAQIGTVGILTTEHRHLVAAQAKSLGIIQEQLESGSL